jgi:hypothetical protein
MSSRRATSPQSGYLSDRSAAKRVGCITEAYADNGVKDARKDRRHRDLVRNSFRAPYGPEQTPEEPVRETAAGEEFLKLLGVVDACARPQEDAEDADHKLLESRTVSAPR